MSGVLFYHSFSLFPWAISSASILVYLFVLVFETGSPEVQAGLKPILDLRMTLNSWPWPTSFHLPNDGLRGLHYSTSFFYFIFIYNFLFDDFFNVWILGLHVCPRCSMCAVLLGTRQCWVSWDCEPLCGGWESNMGPAEEEPGLLTVHSSIKFLFIFQR